MGKTIPIPNRFDLHGITYRVIHEPDLIANNDNLGEAGYRRGEIRLQALLPGSWIQADRQGQVFCHELVHVILHQMHDERRDDEKFVDLFASLLHQALSSAEYLPKGSEAEQ